MATIGQLSVDLLLQSQEFTRSLNSASQQVNQFGRSVAQQNTQMQRSFGAVAGAVGTVKSALASMGVGLSAAAIAGFVSRRSRGRHLQELSGRAGWPWAGVDRLIVAHSRHSLGAWNDEPGLAEERQVEREDRDFEVVAHRPDDHW